MVIHIVDEMRSNRRTFQQYIITYENKETIKELSKLGSITYKSQVINVLFIDTLKSRNELLNVKGIMSVTLPKNGRLINNKEKSAY
ncbi:hypothetical protein [Lysinibacillus sp. NPDC086135]|uniref:hypothetical protein n=1 Tax=Lysinibacillus sp. NPDC086135 TaxID=3364130 RepID=UPI003827053D